MTKRFSLSSLISMLMQMVTPVLITAGLVLCLTSAYELPFEPGQIILFSAVTAFLLSLIFMIPKRRSLFLLLFVLLAAFAGFLLREQLICGTYSTLSALDECFETSVTKSIFPDAAFSFSMLKSGTTVLCALVCFLLTLYFSLCCGLLKAPMLCYVLALPLAVLCVLYVGNPPDLSHLILLVTAILLVPMQQLSCQGESSRIAIVNFMLIILVAAFALNVRVLSTKIDGEWLSTDAFEEFFTVVSQEEKSEPIKFEKPQTKPISDAGQEEPENVVVMTVTSSAVGTVYLRGYSLARYDGESWSSPTESFERESDAALFSAQAAQYSFPGLKKQNMTISYTTPSKLVHVPYFCIPGGDVTISEDGVTLFSPISSYTLDYWPPNRVRAELMELPENLQIDELGYRSYVYENYTADLPEFRSFASSEIGISDLSDREAVVMAVTSYLTSHSSYSRTVQKTPDGEDVGLYFLTVSHTGNCIHYSTSAAAILQSLGIPTRFVGGYRTTITQASVAKEVTDLEAHAWIEVYFDGVGWLPFEATFSGGGFLRTPDPTVTPIPSATPEHVQPPSIEPKPSIAPLGTPSVSPSPKAPDPTEPKAASIPTVLWVVIGLCLLILLTVLRRILKRTIRFRRWAKMSNNRYAISAYRYSKRLASLGLMSPEIVTELANKARFSQHKLTSNERRLIERAITKQCADIRTLNKLKQFFIAYIAAEY